MTLDYETLKIIWWGLIGLFLIGFAVTDGFDMGVGALIPFIGQTDEERRVLINAIGPTWESNQVWLVSAAGFLFAAWPMVYATTFSGFYFAILLALFCLFLRPVGFDYRSKLQNARWRNAWDWGLCVGGAGPALIFGIIFGNLLEGVPFHFDNDLRTFYTGSFWELFNPFGLLAGLISLSMVVMHGSVYLQMKTEGRLASRCQTAQAFASMVLLLAFSVAGLLVAFSIDGYRIDTIGNLDGQLNPLDKTIVVETGAWMSNYRLLDGSVIAPVLVFLLTPVAFLLCRGGRPGTAFVASSLAVSSIIATAGLAMYPFLVPSSSQPNHSLTIWDSSSSLLTLKVLFWVTVFLLPIVVAYTSWVYRVMKGKVTVDAIRNNQHTSY